MAIKFIIDSASDVLPSEAEKLGVTHIPLKVIFGEDEYLDAINLSHREFYEKLVETDTLSTTCQIPPADFMSAYEHLTANGDEVIVITLSSELSGTYQSAVMAAEGYEGKVYVVDSRSVCIGERILLLRGIALNKQGLSAEEIVSELNAEKNKIRVLALLDTLEYLKKGGRISAATALAGGILSIKPVIAVNDGKVELVGKARGSKKGNNLLRELVEKCGGINFDKPLALAYSGLTDELLKKYIKDSEELWQGHTDELQITTVGCTIGTHVGPGAVAVAFFEK
ncbi:MAG: DegV family protein [Anaerofustis stercorihominis]|nr:DegV family protein [Anaerofustis stercorihominis]